MLQLKAILHPTDFSPPSDYAFRLAGSLARDHAARLIVLHVVLTLGPELISHGEAVSQLQPDSYRHQLWEDLRRVQLPDPVVPVEHLLAEGDPAAEIVRAAQNTGAELIVMATHGRTGLQRLLMGSVAEQVMRKASCPVLTVKAPHVASS
ncbi:MAG: universal stress protein [Gemmataceae bacterium]|nr:universal stress protein [Gemmataceae bacterium]